MCVPTNKIHIPWVCACVSSLGWVFFYHLNINLASLSSHSFTELSDCLCLNSTSHMCSFSGRTCYVRSVSSMPSLAAHYHPKKREMSVGWLVLAKPSESRLAARVECMHSILTLKVYVPHMLPEYSERE